VASLLAKGNAGLYAPNAARGTAYRINCGDAPMNCHTCSTQTTGRVTLKGGKPVVRCVECLQRIGYADA
jgi:hypothetical protein